MNLKFCPNLSFLFLEESCLLKRYSLAKESGFTAVEGGNPYAYTTDEVKTVKEELQLEQILINTYQNSSDFGYAALPGKEKEFQNSINLALLYAKALQCKKIHIMSGTVSNPTVENDRIYESNLKYVSKVLETENIIGLIEPINPNTVENYYMNNFEKAVKIIKAVNSPNLRLLLDLFHLQSLNGDLTKNIKNYMPYVGHIQIAQLPGRNEPSTIGEIDFRYIFRLLKELKYADWIGLEYKPTTSDTRSSFKWLSNSDYVS